MVFIHMVILLAAVSAIHGQRYSATFDMQGYRGNVGFQPSGSGMEVTVQFTEGARVASLNNFLVMDFPPVFGGLQNSMEVCQNLGNVLTNLTGTTNGTTTTVSQLSVNDIFSRGLLVTSDIGATLCAIIVPEYDEVFTKKAKFIGPIVGEVWIRYRSAYPGALFLSNLAYSAAVGDAAGSTAANLTIFEQRTIGVDDFKSRCVPLNSTSSTTVSEISIGNSAASTGKASAVFVKDIDVQDEGILGITNDDDVVACAIINAVNSKALITDISWDNVVARFTMTQRSPFDVTTLNVSLKGLTKTPAGFHVHEFPVPQRLTQDQQRCSGSNVGGHYNPYEVDIDQSPAPGSGTSDQYELGDLSGKYGLLSMENVTASYTDWNLPLFGVHSVVGRSIVIHYPNGSRWVCATIGYPDNVITAVVRFKEPAYGYMYFRQTTDNVDSDTSIFGELANLNAVASSSHNYHVHVSPAQVDCTYADGHYDPAGLGTSPSYSDSCTADDPLQCEIGDLSGRHGRINIGSNLNTNNKFFVTDTNLPLAGPYSVIGRSVVIHGANAAAARYACANITSLRATTIQTVNDTWRGDDSDGTVTGRITISQLSEFDRAQVSADINGLNNQASTYHIHKLPIPSSVTGIGQCSPAAVEGHYNPFGVPTVLPPESNTYDFYEVGDLSGKYGVIPNPNRLALESQLDNNLPLTTGIVSSAGRSIVIHKTTGGTRWKCNTIDLIPTDSTGYVVTAETFFKDTSIKGTINWRQVVYDDGSASVTTILVSLFNENTSSTPNHNWHIHIDPVLNETECDVANGHYDPYMAKSSLGKNYSTVCNRYNPFACEVGDISNKQEQYTINGKTKLFVDEDTPFHTNKTVLGRSVVFHAANGGASRLVCANILPPTQNTYTLAFSSDVIYDYYRFTQAVANSLQVSRMRVIVLHNTAVPVSGNGCSKVMIHIAGTVLDSDLVNNMLSGSTPALSPYNPTSNCKSEPEATVVGLTKLDNGSTVAKVNLLVVTVAALLTNLLQKI